MRLLKLLLSSSIIYIATIAMEDPIDKVSDIMQCNALKKNYNLSDNIYPLHYNIKLNFTPYYLAGEYVITIYIIYAKQHISFHLSNSIIKSISSINLELKQIHSGNIFETLTTRQIYKTNSVFCHFNATILPGIYNLHIQIKIPTNIVQESFGIPYINENGHKVWFIITGIQTRKQQLFPFWNNPKLRMTFDISIKHHRSYKTLSNMPIRKSRPTEGDEVWTYFNKTALISIDNVAFVVFVFHRINLNEIVSMWCRPKVIPYVKFASYIIKNITVHLGKYWNKSKRFLEWTTILSESKVDHIAIPNLQNQVKHILGFVFHRETDIMYNEELDTTARKMIIAPLVVRRMIQKYIGNLLNPFYWIHVWLNKGFIIFFQAYIIHETVPDFRMMNLFIVQIQHELLDLNTYVNLSSTEYEDDTENYLYTFLFHVKGSIIWRMLERTLSPSIFSKAINIHLDNQHDEPLKTTSDNLWIVMQTIIDEWDSKYQFNVKSTVYSWAMQRCFPILDVMRNYSNNTVTISAQFHNKLDKIQHYIPITYTTESESNFTITWSNIWLTPSNSKIKLFVEKDQWIILNLQQAGYYRVNYDIENWRKITRYLNSEEYRNIHVLNRAQIINDAFHFVIEKKLKFSLFWELAIYLRKEKDYIAWYPMIKAFEFMSNIFIFFEFYPQFKEVRKPLELEWNLFSRDSYDNHTECLKQELAKWICLNDDICKETAYEQLKWNQINPIRYKLSPGWKRWTYCNGLKLSNFDTWNRTFNFSVKKIDYTILECLAYSENFQITVNYLEEKLPASFETFKHIFMTNLSDDKSIKRSEALIANIFLFILAKNTKYILKDIFNNFKKFTYYYWTVNEMVALTVIINNVHSKEQLNEIKKFIRNGTENFRYPLATLQTIDHKIEIRRSEIKRQTDFLQSLFTN